VTGELIIALAAEDGPAGRAGVVAGDAVLAVQGVLIESEGEEALEDTLTLLEETSHLSTVELVVQTKVRTEVIEFGSRELGGPKNFLGLSFYSFPGDSTVRITKVDGPAARTERFALGDRIVSMNGIRVNHAKTLSDHISAAALTSYYVTFEVALGYASGEGLWYGSEEASAPTAASAADESAKPKPKRSFSFGRKPRH